MNRKEHLTKALDALNLFFELINTKREHNMTNSQAIIAAADKLAKEWEQQGKTREELIHELEEILGIQGEQK